MDGEGNWCEEESEINRIVTDYFKEIYKTQNPNHFGDFLDAIKTQVIDEMNQHLLTYFTPEEIQTAIKLMHPTKTLGPDGMPAVMETKQK